MKTTAEKVVCENCGAVYDRLPAFTCPRCSAPLCRTGCEGCKADCALRKKTDVKVDGRESPH